MSSGIGTPPVVIGKHRQQACTRAFRQHVPANMSELLEAHVTKDRPCLLQEQPPHNTRIMHLAQADFAGRVAVPKSERDDELHRETSACVQHGGHSEEANGSAGPEAPLQKIMEAAASGGHAPDGHSDPAVSNEPAEDETGLQMRRLSTGLHTAVRDLWVSLIEAAFRKRLSAHLLGGVCLWVCGILWEVGGCRTADWYRSAVSQTPCGVHMARPCPQYPDNSLPRLACMRIWSETALWHVRIVPSW